MMQMIDSRVTPREVMGYVHTRATGRFTVVEGPPLYVYPSHPAQHPSHPAFVSGWRLVDALRATLPVQQWNLIDDFNNRPVGAPRPSAQEAIEQAMGIEPSLAGLWSFRTIPEAYKGNGLGFWESQFARESGDNTCRHLDAVFQTTKLAAALRAQMQAQRFDWRKARHQELEARLSSVAPCLLMIHPDEFRAQQADMLPHMLGQMRTPSPESIYQRISREARRELLEATYTHIWLDNIGEISGVTTPTWNGSVFAHQEVHFVH